MAVNPLLSLQTQVPDVGQTITSVVNNANGINQMRENRQMAPMRMQAAQTEADMASLKSNAIVAGQILPMLDANDTEGAMTALTARRDQLKKLNVNTAGVDQGIMLLQKDPTGGLLKQAANQAIQMAGMFDKGGKPAGLVEFETMTKGMSAEDQEKSRRIALGLDARAQGSSAITTATTPGLTGQVAGSQATIAGAKAGATKDAELDVELRKLPDLKAAVAMAESDAKSKGEALTDLNRAKAVLPGLEQTISSLKELAPLVTYTYGGKVYDAASKQLGFGATEGSTARAKFISTVNNQVLPLLKDTFGAAFTVKEGDELKAAMADVDSSPDEKIAQLDAFIDQKYKQIQANERQLGQNTPPADESDIDALVDKYAP